MSAAKQTSYLRLVGRLCVLSIVVSCVTVFSRDTFAQASPDASTANGEVKTDQPQKAPPESGRPNERTQPDRTARTDHVVRDVIPAESSLGTNAPYLLDTGDIIKVTFFKNPDISGQFAVRQDGTVSIPLLGAVRVTGKSVSEAEGLLADRFSALSKRTSYASVEIFKYRPIYVVGFVQRSGSYPWAPNLNVLQAVSLAGGFRRAGDFVAADSDREVGQLAETSELLARALVRRARLISERDGKTEFDVPEELEGLISKLKIGGIVDTERRMLSRSIKIRAATKENRKRLLELSDEEVNAVVTRLEAVRSERQVKVKMVEKLGSLYKKGNTTFRSLNDAETEVARLDSEEGDLLAALARAKQRLSTAQHDVQNDDAEIVQEIERRLAEAEQDIAKYTAEISTSKRVLKRYGAQVCPSGQYAGDPNVSFQIVRRTGAKMTSLNVDDRAPVLPGDTLRVRELEKNCANG